MSPRWSALGSCIVVALAATAAQSQHPPTEWQQPPAEEAGTDAQPRATEEQSERTDQDAEPADPAPEASATVNEPVNADGADDVADKNNRYPGCEFDSIEECDLAAQQSMAKFTRYMNSAAWFSVLLTAVGVLLIWRTLLYTRDAAKYAKTAAEASEAMVDEAKKSTDAAAQAAIAAVDANKFNHRVFIADQRPWVSVQLKLTGPLTWDRDGCNLRFRMTIKNTGKTPSLYTTVHLKVYSSHRPDVRSEQLAFANGVRSRSHVWGATIFPGDIRTHAYSANIPFGQIAEAAAAFSPGLSDVGEWTSPRIIGCVQYCFVFDNTPHQTGFIYEVLRSIPMNGSFVISPSRGDIPLEHLELVRWIHDGWTD